MKKLSNSLEGKTALVTGAASGIGRATAALLAAEGVRVAMADRDETGLLESARHIGDQGGDVQALPIDVRESKDIAALPDKLESALGGLDILVNNAGICLVSPLNADDFNQRWDDTLAINLTAYVKVIRVCLPLIRKSKSGRIISTASTEGLGATTKISPYTTSKHGVIGLTRSLSVELGREGITVNCICPGPIHTGITAVISDEAKDKFARRRIPLRRYGEPEEIAHGIVSLAMPGASFTNGHALVVDGGLTVQNS